MGQWRVVMIRPRTPRDPGKDVTFEVSRLVPFALHVRDGSNGEKDLMMSLSSWHFLVLHAPPAPRVYLLPVLAGAVLGLAEFWLIRRARR